MATTAPITVSQLLAIQPGDRENPSWVNGSFTGKVQYAKGQDGKKPGSGQLIGGDGSSIELTIWGHNPNGWNGNQILVSGKGIQRGEYRGKQNVVIGDKAEVKVIGHPADSKTPAPAAKQETQRSTEPAEDRIHKWFQIYDEVCRQSSGKTQERESLTPEEHTSITTAIWLSFRGDYGAYAPPFFKAAGNAQNRQQQPPSQDYGQSYHNGLSEQDGEQTDSIPF